MVDLSYLLISVLIMSGVTFATRLVPFVFFARHRPGPRFRTLQSRLPGTMLVILLAYSLKDTPWADMKTTLITLGSLLLVILLHRWRRNALVSIFVPTLVYMGLGYYLV
ncbi:MAG: hypothetical protein GW949_09300 [Spirochaetales bacterium]|nr:hypothetical protein [Spirochaetales bacterium]